MSADVELSDVSVTFGSFYAAKNVNVKVNGGEFFSFLGPSGCGKTTLLRAISGFQEPSEGKVLIDNKDMSGIGPNKRPTALIFQNLALFPLMSVSENIAFSLEVRGVSKEERKKRADELLELIALEGQGDKKVHQLSGGQKQRVAIARALAVEPKVLLLDEPLSALDLKLRQRMRTELREIQKRVNITFIYITHDQGEALTMSDRIAVMNEGELEQIGKCDEVYNNPLTPEVARLVGPCDFIDGEYKNNTVLTSFGKFSAKPLQKIDDHQKVKVLIRPSDIYISNEGGENFSNTVISREYRGEYDEYEIISEKGEVIHSRINNFENIAIDSKVQIKLSKNRSVIVYKN